MAQLGGDQAEACLYIGSQGQEHSFIYMAPKESLSLDHSDLPEIGMCTGPTQLTAKHSRIMTAYIAYVLSKNSQLFSTYCIDSGYGVPLPPYSLTWNWTNAFGDNGKDKVEMDFEKMKAFCLSFEENWDNWVLESPWADDEYFQQRVPVGFTTRYGQNQQVCNAETLLDERREWGRQRQWTEIRHINIALATHCRAYKVARVTDIPAEQTMELMQENGWQAFDSHNHYMRREIPDLEHYPIVGPDGTENKVYNQHGSRIKRRLYHRLAGPTAGVLVKFDEIGDLFDGNEDENISEDEGTQDGERRKPTVWVYPQAFLRNIGHIKAPQIAAPFKQIVAQVNDEVRRLHTAAERNFAQNAVTPIRTQMYNQITHQLCKKSGTMELQHGDVTAAMAASYPGQSASTKAKSERLWQRCNGLLPHQRHAELLTGNRDNSATDLRLENTFHIDMDCFPGDNRRGRTFHELIVQPLVEGWDVPHVWEQTRKHLIALKPDIFPDCYLWTAYGLDCILERFWLYEKQRKSLGHTVNPFMIEFVSAVERARVYNATGSARVLHKGVMDPMFLSKGIVTNGFPSLSKEIYGSRGELRNVVMGEHWPFKIRNGIPDPILSTESSLAYHYNTTLAKASGPL